jgi:hypothetical protein
MAGAVVRCTPWLKTACGIAWCKAMECCHRGPPSWYPSCNFAVLDDRETVAVACNILELYQQRVVETLLRSDQNLASSGIVTLLP